MEIELGLTAFSSGRIIRSVRSEPFGMAEPISEPILVESHSTRDIGPLGIGKGFDPNPQAFDTNSTPNNPPRLVVCGNVVASLIYDKDNPTPQELLALSLLEESSELDLDRHEGPPNPLLSLVLGQVLPLEELVCLGGNVTLDFPLPLAIIPADQSSVDCGAHLIDKAEGNRLFLAFEVLENSSLIRYSSKSPEDLVEGPREKRLEMVPSRQNSCNPDCWDKNKFEGFSRFLGYSTKDMEKEILKFFQSLRSKNGKTH